MDAEKALAAVLAVELATERGYIHTTPDKLARDLLDPRSYILAALPPCGHEAEIERQHDAITAAEEHAMRAEATIARLAADEKLRRAIYSVWPGLAQNDTRRLVAAITAALPPCGHEAEIARLRAGVELTVRRLASPLPPNRTEAIILLQRVLTPEASDEEALRAALAESPK